MRGRALAKGLPVAGVALGVVAAVWGTGRLEAHVRGLAEYQSPPEVMLLGVPEGLEPHVMAVIEPLIDCPWTDAGLCRRISKVLAGSAWVNQVHWVRRYAEGRVVVSCDYRIPAALVQADGEFYAVAADGVRLPGRYGYDPALVLVQGVGQHPPEAGGVWPGDDLGAGMDIIMLLYQEPFFDQISGILVENYGGRRDKREPHIQLATAPEGRRIVWGSAPGEEIEENTVEQKLALLRENFRRWGRIDAGRWYIDISLFPDRFTTRDADLSDSGW